MRLNINGKSDSNQNFDLNSNFPSWRFVRNKVHEGGMLQIHGFGFFNNTAFGVFCLVFCEEKLNHTLMAEMTREISWISKVLCRRLCNKPTSEIMQQPTLPHVPCPTCLSARHPLVGKTNVASWEQEHGSMKLNSTAAPPLHHPMGLYWGWEIPASRWVSASWAQ